MPVKVKTEPTSRFGKWFENFWYYHKWHVLLAAFLLFAALVTVVELAGRERYDYKVMLYTNLLLGDQSVQQIAEELEAFGEDLNGDGKVSVQVVDCVVPLLESPNSDDLQMINALMTKLNGIIANDAACQLYITQTDTFDEMSGLLDGEGLFVTADFLSACDGRALQLNGTPLDERIENTIGIPYPDNLYLSVRKVEGTAVASQADAAGYHEQALALLRRMAEAYAARA